MTQSPQGIFASEGIIGFQGDAGVTATFFFGTVSRLSIK